MVHTLSFSYKNSRWVRITYGAGLLLCGVVFILLFGGFPPLAWRFLVHVVATLPVLWTTKGLLVVVPFIGLVLQSLLIAMVWGAWMFAVIKALQYELFQARQHIVQEEPEELGVEYNAQRPPLPAQASPFDAFPDTVYPQIPSSARRYAPLSVSAQHTTSASPSPIPARASARLVTVHEPRRMLSAYSTNNPLSPHKAFHDEDTIEGFSEYPPFMEEFPEEADEQDDEVVVQEQPQPRLSVGIRSHPGVVRKNRPNEDSVLSIQDTYVTETSVVPTGLFVVADGMGGHSNGQEASRLAVCSVSEVVTPLLLNADTEKAFSEDVLQEGVQRANSAIYQHNQQQFFMGTTITSALIYGSTAYVANVGDSRTYLYRPGESLTQITSDHSHVWQLYQQGLISQEDIYTHPKRNEIYRCLGEDAQVEIDTFHIALQAQDVLLLCSDGLWEMVHDAEIERILQNNVPDAEQISAKLIDVALCNGGADNVSVIVVSVTV